MQLTRAAIALTMGVLLSSAAAATADQEMPPLPKPGPEHQLFTQDAGTWDATVEIFTGAGAAPMTSKGVETSTVGCGGLCLVTDFTGQMMPGQPFHGHGTTVYDASKRRYVASWTDSMSAGLAIGESTYDAAAKQMTGWIEGPDATGKVAKMKSVVDYKDAGTRVFTMYGPGPDGRDTMTMRITYKRRS